MTSSVTVSSNQVSVGLTSIEYNPETDNWNIKFTVITGAPYKIVKVLGKYNGISTPITLNNTCNNITKCEQYIYLAIPGCTGLSGTISLELFRNCSTSCPAVENVNVTATIKTGDSCAVTNTIHFSSTTLNAYTINGLSAQQQVQFTTADTVYFGAVLQSSDFDVNLLSFSIRSVCVVLGQGIHCVVKKN